MWRYTVTEIGQRNTGGKQPNKISAFVINSREKLMQRRIFAAAYVRYKEGDSQMDYFEM